MRQGIELDWSGEKKFIDIYGSILDMHTHPRIFDPIIPNKNGANGKAGIAVYTAAALRAGISAMVAMPNESRRIYSEEYEGGSKPDPYPITTPERLFEAMSIAQQESYIRVGMNMGADREIIGMGAKDATISDFTTEHIEKAYSHPYVKEYSTGLKIYGAETTGGYNVPLETIVSIAKVYNEHNPGKPITLHLEDADVAKIMEIWPDGIPVIIAHVSSEQEMEAGIIAIEDGKDVTIEVTPHHMFLTDATKNVLGPGGCVKPSLKPLHDQKYLWANKQYIGQVGSDCAPHRLEDKFGLNGEWLEKPAFGLANHGVYTRAFIEAFYEGRVTKAELYKWFVKGPHERLMIPLGDVVTRYELSPITVEEAERNTGYEYSPFKDTPEEVRLRGHLVSVEQAGKMIVRKATVLSKPCKDNLIHYAHAA